MSVFHRNALGYGSIFLLLLLAGCERGPARIGVSGVVTYKGTRIADGWITFVPKDANAGTQEAARITDGKYELPGANGLLIGEYHVAITATDATMNPASGEAPGAPRRSKALIPEQYNRDSKLSIEVRPDGQREFDFNLE